MAHWRNMLQTAGASGGALSAYDVLIIGLNPLSYYRMDSAGSPDPDLGTLGLDASGSNGVMRQVAGALGPATSPNFAMRFGQSGGQSLIRSVQSASYPDPQDAASLECWIRGTWVGSVQIIAEVKDQVLGQSGPHISLRLEIVNPLGNIKGRRGNATIPTTGMSLNDGNPHHLVLTGPAGSPPAGLKLYVDGAPTGVESASASAPTGTDRSVIIGNTVSVFSPQTLRFDGDVDEVAVYDFELSPAQVLDHYNAGIA